MEIDALSSALTAVTSSTHGTLTNAASVAMLGNAMDLNEVMAESTIKMMENSVTPYLGSNIDVSI